MKSISLGQKFRVFTETGDDCLIYNLNATGPLFYAKQMEPAVVLLESLASENRSVTESKAAACPAIERLWDQLSRSGFFYKSGERPSFGAIAKVDVSIDISSQVERLQNLLRQIGPLVQCIDVHVFEPNARHAELARCLNALRQIVKSGDRPDHVQNIPIRIVCDFGGEDSPSACLLSVFDDPHVKLHELHTGRINRKQFSSSLVEMGFLPTIRLVVTPDSINTPNKRRQLLNDIEDELNREVNREIEILSEGFHGDSECEEIRAGMNNLTALSTSLFELDADISRCSLVQRACSCVINGPSSDSTVEIDLRSEFWNVRHFYDRYQIAASVIPNGLEELVRDLKQSAVSVGAVESQFPLIDFTPHVLQRSNNAIASETQLTFISMRLGMWRRLVEHVVVMLFDLGRSYSESATPLRVDITADRRAEYSPLYT